MSLEQSLTFLKRPEFLQRRSFSPTALYIRARQQYCICVCVCIYIHNDDDYYHHHHHHKQYHLCFSYVIACCHFVQEILLVQALI
jgi:hypothetical protein